MASRLLIARIDSSGYTPVGASGPTAATHRRIVALIHAHLPAVVGSLFAQPQPNPDGSAVEWYSDLAGQPIPLCDLPTAEGERVRTVLANRLESLAELVERLRVQTGAGPQAAELHEALRYPGEETVYVVSGQPVLVFWGHRRVGAPVEDEPTRAASGALAAIPPSVEPEAVARTEPIETTIPPAVTVVDRDGRPSRWRWLLLLVPLLGLAGYAAHRLFGCGERGPDYAALLSAAREEERTLRGLMAEIEGKLDLRIKDCEAQGALARAREEGERLQRALEALESQVEAARGLCGLRQQVDAAVNEGRQLAGTTSKLERDLAAAIANCRRKATARQRLATPTPQPTATGPRVQATVEASGEVRPPNRQRCPGERPVEEAPDVAIVLDSSGSMRLPATMASAEIENVLQHIGGLAGILGQVILGQTSGPSRLDEAKKGVNSVVRSLPADVDIGMTVLADCPRANNLGFFPAARRGELLARVAGLSPMQGTPLAEGVLEAGGMVDGVKAPAIIVVVSDGQDSCHGDPCAAARALKARKPLLTINVVDLIGNGALVCMANATGGKVLKPEDGLAFERTIKEAAKDALKPDYCP